MEQRAEPALEPRRSPDRLTDSFAKARRITKLIVIITKLIIITMVIAILDITTITTVIAVKLGFKQATNFTTIQTDLVKANQTANHSCLLKVANSIGSVSFMKVITELRLGFQFLLPRRPPNQADS